MPLKKPLFSKPAWAAKETAAIRTDKPLFQHNVYEDFVAEEKAREERAAAKKAAKKVESAVNNDSVKSPGRRSTSTGTKYDQDNRSLKKRRTSAEGSSEVQNLVSDNEDEVGGQYSSSEEESDVQATAPSLTTSRSRPRGKANLGHEASGDVSSSSSLSPRPAKASAKPTGTIPGSKALAVNLDEDDDIAIVKGSSKPTTRLVDTRIQRQTDSKPTVRPPEPDSDSDSDEYLRELKRKAREERRAKAIAPKDQRSSGNNETSTTTASTPDDPILQFRITSLLPNCETVLIARRASQTLADVHKYYIDRNNIPAHQASKVFFTWLDNRLHNSTTGRSILNMIKIKYGEDKSEGKVQLEACTDEVLQHRLQQKERARQRLLNGDNGENIVTGTGVPGQAEANVETQASTKAEQPVGIIVKLTAPPTEGIEPLMIRVKPYTTVAKLISGYRKKNKIDPARPIRLMFDGDMLEDELTAEEVGWEDMDAVEVRFD